MIQEAIIGLFATLFTAIITWGFARRKNEAETDTLEIDNIDKVATIWRELAESMKLEVAGLRGAQKEILTKQRKLFEENIKMRAEIVRLEELVKDLTKENVKLSNLLKTN